MQIGLKKISIISLIQAQILMIVLMLFTLSSVVAQESDDVCQLVVIKKAFQAYVQTVDQAQVEKIQTQLNDKGYGPVDVDGVLGQDTRLALQRVCQAYVLKSSESLAADLVALLEDSAQPQVAPEPTETPVPEESPEPQASDVQESKPVVKAIPKPVKPVVYEKDPSVFYRWPASEEEEKSTEDESAKADAEPSEPEITIPDDVLAELAKIVGIPYPNEALFKNALQALFDDSGLNWQPYLGLIQQQAYQAPPETIEEIELDGGGCGCSRDFSSKVFGFYPSWLATGDVQTVDFSLFDRIIFYSLSLNQEGRVENPLQWSNDSNIAAFIKQAHKHRVDVDVSINISGWQSWNDKVMNTAVRKIANTVRKKFTTTNTDSQGALLTMFEGRSLVQGDGVTLYFEDYNGFEDSRHNIVTFVTELSEALKDADDYQVKLNIMLDVDMDIIDTQSMLKDLEEVLIDQDDSTAPVDYVLLFLQEPTSDNKKILRRKIEDEFRGAHRKAVLRKIIPLISPHGHQNDPRGPFTQFTDDLIYFQDNFDGVGLWPLPLDSDQDADTIKQKIIELYSAKNGGNFLGDMIEEYVPGLCQFACPNRWLFRLGFDLLIGLLLIYAVLAIWINYLRVLYKRYFLYFMAYLLVIIAVFLISLACDPFWQERADIVVAGIFIVGFIVVVLRYVNKATRPPLP